MITAAAICPHPPMLVPEVAQGASAELADLRQACDVAVAELLQDGPDHVVVLSGGPANSVWDHRAGGSLSSYGVEVHAGGGTEELPLGLTIGAWLLDRRGWTGSRAYATGEVQLGGRTALLVMADGSAKRSTTAPGYLDQRAHSFDRSVAEALKSGAVDVLEGLDEDLALELWCQGARPLKLLGSLARKALVTQGRGASIARRLRYDDAPLGVGYWVANWRFES